MTEVATEVFTGTRVIVRGVFTSAGSSVAVDPTAVAAKIRKPTPGGGTRYSKVHGVDAEVLRVSAGVYELRWVVDRQGIWVFGFQGTVGSTPVVLDEVYVKVKKPASTA